MKQVRWAAAAALAAAMAAPLGAQAQQVAYASYQLALRAGPDVAYPVVVVLHPNTQVVVQGCLQDYRWCDVTYGPERGWVPGNDLRYAYQNSYRPLPTIATAVGVSVVGFVLYDYWRDHYRERNFYRERDHWVRQVPTHRHWDRGPDHYRGNDRRWDDDRRDHGRDHGRDDRGRDGRRHDGDPGRQAAPVVRTSPPAPSPVLRQQQPAPAPQPVRGVRQDPNSGWDARNPNGGAADKP